MCTKWIATHVKFLTKVKNGDTYIMFPLKFSNVYLSNSSMQSNQIWEWKYIEWNRKVIFMKKLEKRYWNFFLSYLKILDILKNTRPIIYMYYLMKYFIPRYYYTRYWINCSTELLFFIGNLLSIWQIKKVLFSRYSNSKHRMLCIL
jgi:hypothetical protein